MSVDMSMESYSDSDLNQNWNQSSIDLEVNGNSQLSADLKVWWQPADLSHKSAKNQLPEF